MKFIVDEIVINSYEVQADDAISAIGVRKKGDGTLTLTRVVSHSVPQSSGSLARVGAGTELERHQYSAWPLWAKGFKLIAKPKDKGVGDVIVRVIGAENSEAFKLWHKKIFGKDCGCAGRQAEFNRKYPFDIAV